MEVDEDDPGFDLADSINRGRPRSAKNPDRRGRDEMQKRREELRNADSVGTMIPSAKRARECSVDSMLDAPTRS